NGAGKTTLFNLLNGFLRPGTGEILLDGREMSGRKPHELCEAGIGRTFQIMRPFLRMSISDNVVVGAYVHAKTDAEARQLATDAIARVGLSEIADRIAGELTTKELRLMELARALAGQPRILLLDETLAGLGHDEANEVVAVIQRLARDGMTISGIVRPSAGTITFEDHDLLSIRPAQRAHLGIAHVPEGRQVFASLTVMENLEMGAMTEAGQRDWKHNIERIFEWLPILAERRGQFAGTLSGGQQQMLAIGRGLASSPKLLILGEPSMGLAPTTADFIFERLIEIRRESNLTILLVEQRVAEALESA